MAERGDLVLDGFGSVIGVLVWDGTVPSPLGGFTKGELVEPYERRGRFHVERSRDPDDVSCWRRPGRVRALQRSRQAAPARALQ